VNFCPLVKEDFLYALQTKSIQRDRHNYHSFIDFSTAVCASCPVTDTDANMEN
jgi:hypothetical protein